jgi:hypothetical protein
VKSAVMWSCPILTPVLLGCLRIRYQATPHNLGITAGEANR